MLTTKYAPKRKIGGGAEGLVYLGSYPFRQFLTKSIINFLCDHHHLRHPFQYNSISIYLVEEKATHQQYAIKMINVFEEENFEKIKKEVDLVRKFHEHVNIVRYYDYFEERTVDVFSGVELKLFLVMEYW